MEIYTLTTDKETMLTIASAIDLVSRLEVGQFDKLYIKK